MRMPSHCPVSVGLVMVLLLSAGCAGLAEDTTGSTTMAPASTSTTAISPSTSASTVPTTTTTAIASQTRTTESPCESPSVPSLKPLPEKPTPLTRENVTEFTAAVEEALVWNEMASNGLWELSVNVRNVTILNASTSGYILHVRGDTHHRTCFEGEPVAGSGMIDSKYFINDSTTVRLHNPDNQTADPRQAGTIVDE